MMNHKIFQHSPVQKYAYEWPYFLFYFILYIYIVSQLGYFDEMNMNTSQAYSAIEVYVYAVKLYYTHYLRLIKFLCFLKMFHFVYID